MKILFSSTGKNMDAILDGQFGRARGFVLFDEDSAKTSWHSNEDNLNASHGAGIQAAQFAVNTGAPVIITGHVGPTAYNLLTFSKIRVFNSSEVTLKKAYDDFRNAKLKQQSE